MGKEKKKFGIKTTRYYTKNCANCSFEYPNWFTNCPKCGASWNNTEIVPAPNPKMDYYIAEITEIPIGSLIIYYIEVYLEDGEKIIENNEGKYFFYKVGVPIEESEAEVSPQESEAIKKRIDQSTSKPRQYQKPPIETPSPRPRITREMFEQSTIIPQEKKKVPKQTSSQEYTLQAATIFGKPQTEIDPELKTCSHCKSKIKKMWSICPICGKSL